MSEEEPGEDALRDRLSSAGEEVLGEFAQNLLDNPLFNHALATALGAGERALRAQRSAMTALNVPSSGDIERLERRLRSLSDRLESFEDRLDEVEDEMSALRARVSDGSGARERG